MRDKAVRRVSYTTDETTDAIIRAIVAYNKAQGFHGMSESQAITVALHEYARKHGLEPGFKPSIRRGRGRPPKQKD